MHMGIFTINRSRVFIPPEKHVVFGGTDKKTAWQIKFIWSSKPARNSKTRFINTDNNTGIVRNQFVCVTTLLGCRMIGAWFRVSPVRYPTNHEVI